ncbi:hypothetical protein E2C01_072774 [Portunus trituberculatus]|uniref:Uncharacterized protein n=1 Tax=Portunus trituberculatus TaxID=210409 RepID=A0A5B7I8S1_PORTR|nr:hypothetical protein [Portunus trituberculatus]
MRKIELVLKSEGNMTKY